MLASGTSSGLFPYPSPVDPCVLKSPYLQKPLPRTHKQNDSSSQSRHTKTHRGLRQKINGQKEISSTGIEPVTFRYMNETFTAERDIQLHHKEFLLSPDVRVGPVCAPWTDRRWILHHGSLRNG